MDDVLMLYDMEWVDCHLKEYLQVGGYRITEIFIDDIDAFKNCVVRKDVILLVCENASRYFDRCSEIRISTEIPIIVVTKSDDEWTKIKMFRLGVDDYISTPFQEMELIARIKARIEQFRRLTRFFGYIKVRDLVIEAIGRRVYMKEEEVNLSVKEFDTLLFLAQRGNIVVPREELYKAVWGPKLVEGYSETVTTYVMRIRQKIEADPDNPKYIETIWGVGYRFVI